MSRATQMPAQGRVWGLMGLEPAQLGGLASAAARLGRHFLNKRNMTPHDP